MKKRLMFLAALTLCLCTLLFCGSAMAYDLIIPESIDNGSLNVRINDTDKTEPDDAFDGYLYYDILPNDSVTLTGNPASGYRTKSITVSYNTSTNMTPGKQAAYGTDSSLVFSVPDDVGAYGLIVQAEFEEGSSAYAITAGVASDGGTGNTVSVDKATAEPGETVTVTLGMNPGTKLATGGLTVYKSGENATVVPFTQVSDTAYTFTMPSYDVSVSGVFEFIDYTVSVAEVTGCALAADKASAHCGETITVTVSSIEYANASLSVLATYMADGTETSVPVSDAGNNRFTFTMPAGDVTMKAEFTFAGHLITRSAVDATGSEITGNNRATFILSVDGVQLDIAGSYAEAGKRVDISILGGTMSEAFFMGISDVYYTYEEDGEQKEGRLTDLTIDENKNATGYFIMPDSEVTLVAVQEKAYPVIWPDESEYADITVSHTSAFPGETVTVTVASIREGYIILEMGYRKADDTGEATPMQYEESENSCIGTFNMPDGTTTVCVTVSQPPIPFISYNSSGVSQGEQICTRYQMLTASNADYCDINDADGGWYIVEDTISMGSDTTIRVTGNVHLILCDGSTLNANDGIYIRQGSSLSVYGQSAGTGKLSAKPDSGPGIGGMADTVGGSLYIHGGVIDAKGGTNAAGIGGGNHDSGYQNIVIYNGNVTATGGSSGAGIGGGQQNNVSGTIEIYDGTVTATGGKYGAGIGGGEDRGGGIITIRGGTIKAEGGKNATGIGGGDHGSVGTVNIYSGDVTATGGQSAAGIGSGDKSGGSGSITIWGGTIRAYGGDKGAAIGGGCQSDGQTITIKNGDILAQCYTYKDPDHGETLVVGGAGIGGGELGDAGTIRIEGGMVYVRNQMYTHYAGAGIGAGAREGGGSITITGGTIRSYAARGAGIGGGSKEDFTGTITITGGDILASGYQSAGIGGGHICNFEGTIRISGGTVLAKSTVDGAGIGAGPESGAGDGGENKGVIEITGGTVTAMAGGGSSQALGKGDGGSKTGTLNLAEHLKVTSGGKADGSDATLSHRANRTSACHRQYARIEACDHPEDPPVYIMNADGHTRFCSHCLTSFAEEPHTITDGPCEICHYNGEMVTITFDSDGGTPVEAQTLYEGSVARQPDAPVKDGFLFQGWYPVTDEGEFLTEDPFDFAMPITGSITLKAKWASLCIVTFDAEGGSAVETQTVAEGSTATQPDDPAKDGFVFDGWYMVTETGAPVETAFEFDTIIMESITLKAGWRSLYTVTFDSDGGSAVDAQQVAAEAAMVIPDAPTREGYIFMGWYPVTDGEMADDPYDFDDPVTADLTLKARWHAHITVTLQAGSGSGTPIEISSADEENWADIPTRGKFVRAAEGVCFYMPDAPETFTAPEGQSFEGWLVEGRTSLREAGWPLMPLDQDAYTLTAQWAKHYSITWAEMSGAWWMPTGNRAAAAGEQINVSLTFSKELYDEGQRLQSLTITGEGIDPIIVTTDRFGEKLPALTPIDANNGTVLYFTTVFTMPAADVTVTASFGEYESDWQKLQNQIDAASPGATITLTQDYTGEAGDSPLHIVSGQNLIIDLGDFHIDAGAMSGRIFTVNGGTLTITGSGSISGGRTGDSVGGALIVQGGGSLTLNGGTICNNTADNGGAVAVTNGTFTMNGGEISGNVSNLHGGGVHVQGGTFIMTGGSIDNNKSYGNGGGLWVGSGSAVRISGGTVGSNEAALGRDIYLNGVGMSVSGSPAIDHVYVGGTTITVDGALGQDAHIGLTCSNSAAQKGTALTSGLARNGALANFASAKKGYAAALNADGEVYLGTARTVTLDYNDDSSEPAVITVADGTPMEQPETPARDGYVFLGWQRSGEDYDFSAPVTEDITLTAHWLEVPVFGTPDFTLPAGIRTIEANAFEGAAMSVVSIPVGCESIGDYAFCNCFGLTQIRIPAGCALGADVFEGCTLVYVYGAAGSPADAYCQSHSNCVFVAET